MSDSKERLVVFNAPSEQPSFLFAKSIVEDILNGNEISFAKATNILTDYDDQGYAPSLPTIHEWVDQETEALCQAMKYTVDAAVAAIEDIKGIFQENSKFSLGALAAKEITEDELARSLAKSFSWMDRSPFWGGTPFETHWHGAKVQSALLKIYQKSSTIVDTFFDLLHSGIEERIKVVEGLQEANLDRPSLSSFEGEAALHIENIKMALQAQDEIVSLAVKIGFLYRDWWWLENHGDAALKGYIAKETAIKAGSGGSAASTGAKKIRLELFLVAHAKMMRNNHILANDPMEDVAFRAIKIARADHPDIFARGSSKKTAVEYWEYIKSDPILWEKYQGLLLNNKGL